MGTIVETAPGATRSKPIVKAPAVVLGFMPIAAVGTTRIAAKMIGATRRTKTARSVEMERGLIRNLVRPVVRRVGSGVKMTRLVAKVWCVCNLMDIPDVDDQVRNSGSR